MSCNNTNNTCTQCNHNYSSCNNKCAKCGCKDSFLTSPPPCPTPAGCPDPIPCQEVLSSDCIIYGGPDITCNSDTVIYSDSTMTEVLEDIVAYFCLTPIPEILCGTDIVVTEDSSINEALEDIVAYFCTEISNLPTVTVVGGNGVNVTSVVVGNNTTYTVTSTGVKKFVKEFSNVVFDNQTLTITGAELTTCGLLSQACGVNNTKPSDFTFNIMFLSASGVWISLTNTTGVDVHANDTTGNISVILNIAPIDPPVTVRVTIIG